MYYTHIRGRGSVSDSVAGVCTRKHRVLGVPDAEGLDYYAPGVRVGVDVQLPRAPALDEAKLEKYAVAR